MAAPVPSRYGIRIPAELKGELSDTAQASVCFGKQKFSRWLQEYLVDYSFSVGASPIIQSDMPNTAFWKSSEFLDDSVARVDAITAQSKEAASGNLPQSGIIGSGVPLANGPIEPKTFFGSTTGVVDRSQSQ